MRLWNSSFRRWIGPLAWMGVIFVLSAQSKLPDFSGGRGDCQSIAGHVIAYAVLGVLWERALSSPRKGRLRPNRSGPTRAAWWAFLIAVIYGLTDEFHQSFVPGRNADLFDLATDAVAAGLAILIVLWLRSRRLSSGLAEDTY